MTALAMPVSPRRGCGLVSDAPPMLTPTADCVAQVRGRWFAAEVQTHHEKPLAWSLLELGLAYYLPLAERVRIAGGVKRRKIVPLFQNYIFAADDAEQYLRESRYVFGILNVADQRGLVRELSSLEIALHANPRLEAIEVHSVGQLVRVTGGAMEGMEGRVEGFREARGYVKVDVQIKTLGRAVTMEIDRSFLEAIPEMP